MSNIRIKDQWLREALREEVSGRDLTIENLSTVTRLSWDEYRAEAGELWSPVENLSGIEHCVNLRHLGLDGNHVRSLRPLAGLDRLEELWMVQNDVIDVKPLAGLSSLTTLVLEMNYHLKNVSPLADSANLQYLNIADTSVTDLAPLLDLPALTRLAWKPRTWTPKPISGTALRRAESVLVTLKTRGVTIERYQLGR